MSMSNVITEKEAQVIAWEEMELEDMALISSFVVSEEEYKDMSLEDMSYIAKQYTSKQETNEVIVHWRYLTGIDADTEVASASIPYKDGFHKVIDEDNQGVVFINNGWASFGSDEEDAFDNFLHDDKEIIEERCVFFD